MAEAAKRATDSSGAWIIALAFTQVITTSCKLVADFDFAANSDGASVDLTRRDKTWDQTNSDAAPLDLTRRDKTWDQTNSDAAPLDLSRRDRRWDQQHADRDATVVSDDMPRDAIGDSAYDASIADLSRDITQDLALDATVDRTNSVDVTATKDTTVTVDAALPDARPNDAPPDDAGPPDIEPDARPDAQPDAKKPFGTVLWAKRFGGTGNEFGYDLAVDHQGDVVLTGVFSNTIDFGVGPRSLASAGLFDVFLAKVDSTGTVLWAKRFGDTLTDYGYSVAAGASGIRLVGRYSGSPTFGGAVPLEKAAKTSSYIASFDSAGNYTWAKGFVQANPNAANGVAMDSAGNAVVTGTFASSIDFGGGMLTSPGGDDVFVASFDAGGAHRWSRSFGNVGIARGMSVAVDSKDSVIITGSFEKTVWFGNSKLVAQGGSDIFTCKLDSTGKLLWAQPIGSGASDVGYGVTVGANDAIWATGDYSGGILLSHFSSAGVLVHVQTITAGLSTKGFDIAFFQDSALVAGYFTDVLDFGAGQSHQSAGLADAFVYRHDATTGKHLWSAHYGAANNDTARAIAVNAQGDIYLLGDFHNNVNFGDGPRQSAGGSDVFVLEIAGP